MAETIKSKGIFCCDTFILDQNNKVSLIGIFQKLNAHAVPTVHPKMTFAAIVDIADSKEKYDVVVKLISPGKIALSDFNFTGKKDSSSETVNILIDIVNFTFKEYGRHRFELYINNVLIDSTYIDVVKPDN